MFWKRDEHLLAFCESGRKGPSSGTAWYVAPTAGPGLVPPWGEAQPAERGEKGVWCLSCYHLTGFKPDSEFKPLLIFAWMFFNIPVRFFLSPILLSFLAF